MVRVNSLRSIAAGTVTALAIIAAISVQAYGQRGPARDKDVLNPADADMETTAKHDLSVARWYMDNRKAYAGARDRLKGIVDTYPEFSRVHEAFYYLAQADEKLGNNDEAASCYRKLIKDFPGSEYVKKAKDRLAVLKLPEDGPLYKPSPPKPEEETDTKADKGPTRPTLRGNPSPSPSPSPKQPPPPAG
jgi:tetratricopeptide (TPR) repeat protein